jgi:N-acetylated-alpha-linked acidic dipeptidase
VLRHANAEILPVDWRETVAEFATTLATYEAAAADHADLTPARTALDALSGRLAELYRAIEARRVEPGVANDALMRLARVLVPINFTREPRFRHDPAYTVPPLPSLAVAAELSRIDASRLGFAKTQLLRGQNRFVAALREAARIAAAALQPASA